MQGGNMRSERGLFTLHFGWGLLIIFFFFTGNTLHSQKLMNWTGFKWGRDSVRVDGKSVFVSRSAILLPVEFEGDARRYYLQLDLNSAPGILLYALPISLDTSKVNSKPLRQSGDGTNEMFALKCSLRGKLGITEFTADSSMCMLMRSKQGNVYLPAGRSIIGIIGLRFFKNRELMIDFPRQQFTLASSQTILPLTYRDSSLYIPLKVEHERLILPVSVEDTSFTDFFYNTGNAIFDIVVSKKIWQRLTGRVGEEKDNTHITMNSWGNLVEAIGTKLKHPAKIGASLFQSLTIFYLPAYPDMKAVYGCNGFLGNSLFYNKTLIIDIPRKKLGIMNEM